MNKKGIGTLQGVIVVIVVIAIVVGVGAWYFMGGEEEPTNGGPTNGNGDNEPTNGGPEAPSVIKVGWPSPLSGVISPFGVPDKYLADTLEDYINNEQGGVYLSKYDEKVPIEILLRDTESDPKTAASVATSLVTKEKVDIMHVQHTPLTTVPVCGISEKYGVPTVSLDTPIESWLEGAPYKWCYHVFWFIPSWMRAMIETWEPVRDQTSEVVGVLFPQDPDGVAHKRADIPILEEAGYEVVFTGHFPPDMKDFSSIISAFKREDVDIVTGVVPTPTLHTFLKQSVEMDFNPKIEAIGKGALFPASMGALGKLSKGAISETWWHPSYPFESSLTGESCSELAEKYEEDMDKPWTAALGTSYAGIEIVVDVLERAGSLEPEVLREAIASTDMTTVMGPIDFKGTPKQGEEVPEIAEPYKDRYAIVPVVMAQWFPGEEWPWMPEVVCNWKYDDIPETRELLFPYPMEH